MSYCISLLITGRNRDRGSKVDVMSITQNRRLGAKVLGENHFAVST
jgi:hypothetical protein